MNRRVSSNGDATDGPNFVIGGRPLRAAYPARPRDLGLPPINSNGTRVGPPGLWAWRGECDALHAPLIVANYSRLGSTAIAIRPWRTSIPTSANTESPSTLGLSAVGHRGRAPDFERITADTAMLDRGRGGQPTIPSPSQHDERHSRASVARSTPAGSTTASRRFADWCSKPARRVAVLVIGDNEPYLSVSDETRLRPSPSCRCARPFRNSISEITPGSHHGLRGPGHWAGRICRALQSRRTRFSMERP